MKGRRTLAVVLAFLIVMSMLPTMVFASEDAVQLTGELKLKGLTGETVRAGDILSADYAKVIPEGFTDDMVTFLWTLLDPSDVEYQKNFPVEERQYPVLRELGRENTFIVTDDLAGSDIMLTVTAKEEYGYTGSLYVISGPVAEAVSVSQETVIAEEPVDAPDEEPVLILDDEPEYTEDSFEPDAGEWSEEQEILSEEPAELTDEPVWEETPVEEEQDSRFYEEDPDQVIDITTSEVYDSENPDAQSPETVSVEEGSENPVYEVTADIEKVDFGTLEPSDDSSYYTQQAKVVEVTNTGDMPLNFAEIAPEHFMVADIEETLEPTDTVSLWIQPRAGLEPGTYTDTISYVSEEGAAVSYDASVVILEPQASETEEITDAIDVSTDQTEALQDTETETEILEDLPDDEILESVDDPDSVTGAEENAPADTNDQTTEDPGTENPGAQDTNPEEPDTGNSETENPDAQDPDAEGQDPETPDEPGDNPEEPAVSLEFTDSVYQSLSFGTAEEGADVPAAQAVIVSNTGNVTVTLQEPYSVTGEFNVSHTEDLTLEPTETLAFTIQPKTGLSVGAHESYVHFYLEGEDDASLSTLATFQVTEKPKEESVKLVRIQAPSAISGIANGTAKDASALGLPSSVVIETSDGNKNAAVAWNVQASSYQPAQEIAQTFQVTGTVTLPEGVANPDNISLQTAVNVTVDAKQYVPVKVSSSDNKITGIANNGEYPAQQGIKFQAVGAGMDNKNPQTGDQRYLPLSCTVVKTYTWESAPYEATIRLSNPGDYTLKVVFNLQEYTGSGWTNVAGAQDTKTVSFLVVSANPTATATPTITPTPAGKRAVATGDDTPILPMVIILVAAAAVVGGILFIRRKK